MFYIIIVIIIIIIIILLHQKNQLIQNNLMQNKESYLPSIGYVPDRQPSEYIPDISNIDGSDLGFLSITS